MNPTRRELLKATGPIAAALLLPACKATGGEDAPAPLHELPPLPYAYDALEPHIDAKTMEIHHGKHHAAYVANLNKALAADPELAKRPLEALLHGVPDAVRNNAGGHSNHTMFWKGMGAGKGGEPKDAIGAAIAEAFGGFAKFRELLADSAMKRFGSGWAWLQWKGGVLEIASTPNQDSPLAHGAVPILGIDVWEHAYYLKYQNRRAEYVAAWWNVVDWEEANRRLKAARA